MRIMARVRLDISGKDFTVRSSAIEGRGLFARRAIPARRKLGEFGGELITLREARRRARLRRRITIVEFDRGMARDASRNGTCFRYVNHSCLPNAYIRRVGYHVEFYSLRMIRAGEEVTCDYGETQHKGTLRCRCGSSACRQWL
jgi:SET domain-containing protein